MEYIYCRSMRSQESVTSGRIFRILVTEQALDKQYIIVIEQFHVLVAKNIRLNMPVLKRTHRTCFVEPSVSTSFILGINTHKSSGYPLQIQCPA